MYLTDLLDKRIADHQKMINAVNEDASLKKAWGAMVTLVINTYKVSNGKIFFCGNGGSAADAQHIAAELSGRFYKDRPALYAEAFHVNTSFMTAVANDYGYEHVFARAVDAYCHENDVLFALSTSGNSKNILLAADKAKEKGVKLVAWTGKGGGELAGKADIALKIPSTDTARIQEAHIFMGHTLCEAVEHDLFPDE
jgi:D-sedoheptulose 7-phosphate isomerase